MKRVIVVAAAFGVAAWMAIAGSLAAAATPRWVRHVQRYPGGISNGVRAYTDSGLQRAQAASKFRSPSVAPVSSQSAGSLQNLQVNVGLESAAAAERDPGRPQLRTTTGSPWAAANDYVNGGSQIYRTTDGGQSWTTQYPLVGGRGDGRLLRRRRRSGADLQPARPRLLLRAAVLLPRLPAVGDRGDPVAPTTARPGRASRHGAYPVSNFSPKLGDFNPALFYDKEQITVDNNPSSPHYGRIYVTYIKFHMQPNGFSDYCPVQVAYTDNIDPNGDGDLTDAVWHHTEVVTRQPGWQRQGPVGQPGRAAGRRQPGRRWTSPT